jgi:hypothetical protein
VTIAFEVPDRCTSATLELELTGPWAKPSQDADDQDQPCRPRSIRLFYPPDNDRRWGANGDHDNNPPVIAMLACASALAIGHDMFQLATGNPSDDIYIGFTQVRCRP